MDDIARYDTKIELARNLLPAWFIERMMTDNWWFGLLLTTGQMLFIEHIDDVHRAADGGIWIDVTMATGMPLQGEEWHKCIMFSPTENRTTASLNAAHVVLAVELADT